MRMRCVCRNEYLCFQKITKLEYSIPEGFPDQATDIVTKLLVSAAQQFHTQIDA